MDTYYIEAAVPAPLMQVFDYKVSAAQYCRDVIQPGMRICVPFGRRQLVAVVLKVKSKADIESGKIKAISALMDDRPLLTQPWLKLLDWASRYYHFPIGEVVANALPKKLRQAKSLVLTTEQDWMQVVGAKPMTDTGVLLEPELQLNDEQASALAAIRQQSSFQVMVLQGVTGSGKTEVYLQAIANVLQQGRHAMVLVPEIGLTPQTVARFERRFSVPIVCLHSAMTDTERMRSWLKARAGQAAIVIGTRSALFVPMQKLGLIIIDEEHDSSFRQQSGFRYVGRDVAIMLAKTLDVPIVLGTATPSLVTLANIERRRYQCLRLPHRVAGGQLPSWRIVDVRDQSLSTGLSSALIARMHHHLSNGGQVLIFLNRRGYAPVLLCHHCGYSHVCQRCDAHMTLHRQPYRLICHHCGSSCSVPTLCPSCKQSDLSTVGVGTEQLQKSLQELFPDKNVLRLDRDSARGHKKLKQLLTSAHDQSADILLGTQMLAKGHHFPALTLVGILDIDAGLLSADYQALEQLGQTCCQVAGRAGRESVQGEVILQTHCPDHAMLRCLVECGYETFAEKLLKERKQAELPPWSYWARWVINGPDRAEVMAFANRIQGVVQQRRAHEGVGSFGPVPALMERVNNRYFVELIMMSSSRQQLQRCLSLLHPEISALKCSKSIRWFLQVD